MATRSSLGPRASPPALVCRKVLPERNWHTTAGGTPAFPGFPDGFLYVVEQRHEAEVHVELLVAVEECQARIIGDEIDFVPLVAA